MNDRSLGDVAKALAEAEMGVFPLTPRGTQPLEGTGPHRATHNHETVWSWWDRNPGANIGMRTGPGGFDVLDVDTSPAGSGFAAYRQLKEAGLLEGWVMKVSTPNDGLHLYFLASPDAQPSFHLPHAHLDFIGEGGWVIAPPSRVDRADGTMRTYEVLEHRETDGGYLDAAAVRAMFPAPARANVGDQIAGLTGKAAQRYRGILAKVTDHDGPGRGDVLAWATRKALEIGAHDLLDLEQAAAANGLDTRSVHTTIETERARHTQQHARGVAPAITLEQSNDVAPSAVEL